MDKLVRRRHAVPNALLPTITLVFLNIGFVVSGAITVETVFSWPGLGPADATRRSAVRTCRCCRRSSCCSRSRSWSPTSWPTSWSPPSTRGCAHDRPERRADSSARSSRAGRGGGRPCGRFLGRVPPGDAPGWSAWPSWPCSSLLALLAPLLFSSRRAQGDRGDRRDVLAAAQRRLPAGHRRVRPVGARPGRLGHPGVAARRDRSNGHLDGHRHLRRHLVRALPRLCPARCSSGSPTGSWSSRSCRWRSCSSTVLGSSLLNVIVVIGVTSWPGTARLVRAQTLSVEARPYLERARVLGGGHWHQMSRHVLPNVMPLVLANTTLTVADRDPVRDDAVVPRARRPVPRLLGLDARRRVLRRRDQRRRVVVPAAPGPLRGRRRARVHPGRAGAGERPRPAGSADDDAAAARRRVGHLPHRRRAGARGARRLAGRRGRDDARRRRRVGVAASRRSRPRCCG